MSVAGPAVTDVPGAVAAAVALRRELGVADDAPLPCVLQLAEEHVGVDVVVARLPWSCSGFYLPASRRGFVAVNGDHAVVRQRFTVAHEVGHHVLGHGAAPRIVPLAETPTAVEGVDGTVGGEAGDATGGEADAGRRITDGEATTDSAAPDVARDAPTPGARAAPVPDRPRRSRDPRERAANAFAAELLCPATAARTFVDAQVPRDAAGDPALDFDFVVRLSAAFGISAAAVLTRLETAAVLADPPLRAALQARVDAAEHVPRYGELGLRALVDELQRVADARTLPRLPEGVDADVLLAVTTPETPATRQSDAVRNLRALLGLPVRAG